MRTAIRGIILIACVVALTLSAAAQTIWAVPGANGGWRRISNTLQRGFSCCSRT